MEKEQFAKLKVGDRVRFSSYGENDKRKSGVGEWYPTLGTLGTIKRICGVGCINVQWDSGVKSKSLLGDRTWAIDADSIEFVSREFKKGDRVVYNGDDCDRYCYPPKGTKGTVIKTDNGSGVEVQWDEGTKGDHIWWAAQLNVELDKECAGSKVASKSPKFKVGDRVRYISDRQLHGWYPPKGTLGTVTGYGSCKESIHVKWDSGVAENREGTLEWYCSTTQLELVATELTDEDILKAGDLCVADEYKCGKCPYKCKGGDCEDILLEDLHALAKRLKETNAELRKAFEAVQEELAECKKDRDAAQDVAKSYKERCNELLEERQTLREENGELKDKINATKSLNKLLQKENGGLNAQVKSLSDKLAENEHTVINVKSYLRSDFGSKTQPIEPTYTKEDMDEAFATGKKEGYQKALKDIDYEISSVIYVHDLKKRKYTKAEVEQYTTNKIKEVIGDIRDSMWRFLRNNC